MHQENQAEIAALQQRMAGVENDIHDIKQSIASGRTETLNALHASRTETSAALTMIHTKLDQRATTQWGPIWAGLSVGVAVLGILGASLYAPIRERQAEIQAAFVVALREGKQDRKEDIDGLVRRDQRIWDSVLDMRRQIDRMEGEWRATRRPQ